jgi:hypothetical protein
MSDLKATHLVDDGAYIVEPVYGFGSGGWEVDGLPVPNGNRFVVSDPSKVIRVTKTRGSIVAYESTEGEQLAPAAYDDKKATLLIGATTDNDDDWVFPNLDAEFEYRKFIARWKVVFGPEVVTRTPATFELAEVRRNSGDPDIVSLWNAPHTNRDATLYSFNRATFGMKLVAELAKAHGLTLDQPNHSGLRFAKLDGAYAFDDSYGYTHGRETFIGTLETCKQEKAELEARVRSIVRGYVIKKEGKPLVNAGDVLVALQHVQASLSVIATKGEASKDALSMARKRLRDLAAELVKDAA